MQQLLLQVVVVEVVGELYLFIVILYFEKVGRRLSLGVED